MIEEKRRKLISNRLLPLVLDLDDTLVRHVGNQPNPQQKCVPK